MDGIRLAVYRGRCGCDTLGVGVFLGRCGKGCTPLHTFINVLSFISFISLSHVFKRCSPSFAGPRHTVKCTRVLTSKKKKKKKTLFRPRTKELLWLLLCRDALSLISLKGLHCTSITTPRGKMQWGRVLSFILIAHPGHLLEWSRDKHNRLRYPEVYY